MFGRIFFGEPLHTSPENALKEPRMLDTGKLTLHTMMGNYPITKALKTGAVTSDLAQFDFVDVKVANNQFKQVVRDAKYDVAELAIVTYLQAKAYGKPYALIPAVLVSRGQHHTIAYNAERGPLKPSGLNGKRVGIRAYTVTTATWVRGILASDYGVDLDSIEWITFEDPHVAEYRDPAFVRRAPAGKELAQMLLDGEIDAAVVGDKLPDPRLKHLIPDPEAAARAWAERHGGVPINHLVVVRESLSGERPDVVRDVFRQLHRSKLAAGLADGGVLDPYRFGVEACRPVLEVIIDFCWRQQLLPRRLTVDELFDETTAALAP
jgi:4,5-dihydroxyphthalate decarboxylase